VSAITNADHAAFAVREVEVTPQSACAGLTFQDAQLKQKTGALVVALRPASDRRGFLPNPPDSRQIDPGDILIAIGSPEQLTQLLLLGSS